MIVVFKLGAKMQIKLFSYKQKRGCHVRQKLAIASSTAGATAAQAAPCFR
jgi:hypothetical protein